MLWPDGLTSWRRHEKGSPACNPHGGKWNAFSAVVWATFDGSGLKPPGPPSSGDDGTPSQTITVAHGDSDWEKLQRKLNEERIRWKFITPRVPWCGGYWERFILSIIRAFLKYDELHTVLCEIEARINDRPLVFMDDDIAGEAALTPAHLLIGRELTRLPSLSTGIYRRDDSTSGVNHLIRRWRYQQRMTVQLWKRWKQEYVTTLTTRGRWRKTQQEPRVGDIVLVHEPSTAWIKWPIGRIIEIHPSEDGVVRSATVKTRQRTVTRSARSLLLVEPSGDA
ncbi:conserved hypothetical protein [Trichinella spiralis]|uniref:hypothetical protein n=1 Tax=Trichinella spiralis TaxID=6334 RepID=UPI0001EFECC3|nr:conserved hypothetical protein [Trichinella spiralis]